MKQRIKQGMKNIDFHMHTTYSDGNSDPGTLVRDSRVSGLDAIAISDHDHIQGYFDALPEARKYNLGLIPGTEITTGKYHILGLGFNPEDKRFLNFLEHSRNLQEKNTKGKIEMMQKEGVPINFEELRAFFPNSRLGSGNILTYMRANEKTREYLHEKGIEKREDLIKFIRKVKSNFNDFDVNPENAIEEIHNAGGIAIIAHPFKQVKNMEELDYLVSLGLDGLEIQPNYNGKNEPFKEYALKNNLIITYGSDYHGIFLKTKPLLQQGMGQISEELLEKLLRNTGIRL